MRLYDKASCIGRELLSPAVQAELVYPGLWCSWYPLATLILFTRESDAGC